MKKLKYMIYCRIIVKTIFCLGLMNTLILGQLTVQSQFRPRFEYRNGYSKIPGLNNKPTYFVSQRLRLNLIYTNSALKYIISIQDIRTWGDATIYKSTGVYGKNASIDLFLGYLEWFISDNISLSIGRQNFIYDDERLLSGRNWNQHGLAYDALLIKSKMNGWDFHFGVSLNNNAENKFGNFYEKDKLKTLNFIYLKKPFDEDKYLSIVLIGSGNTISDSSEVINMRGTFGINYFDNSSDFELKSSAFYQYGKNTSGILIQSYFLCINANIKNNWAEFGGGIDYLSGNSENTKNKKDKTFNLLYGARHKFYGLLDYFSDLEISTQNRGLVDLKLHMAFQLTKDSKVNVDFHLFNLQDNRLISNRYLGNEIDVIYSRQFNPEIKMSCGFSIFNSTKYFNQMQSYVVSDRIPVWCWINFNTNLSLFESK